MRGSKVLDTELQRYFGGELEADLGRRGVALEPTIRGDRDVEPGDRAIHAAAEARRIEAALFALSHADQLLLRAAHRRHKPTPDQAPLGELAPVVCTMVDPPTARRRARLAHTGMTPPPSPGTAPRRAEHGAGRVRGRRGDAGRSEGPRRGRDRVCDKGVYGGP